LTAGAANGVADNEDVNGGSDRDAELPSEGDRTSQPSSPPMRDLAATTPAAASQNPLTTGAALAPRRDSQMLDALLQTVQANKGAQPSPLGSLMAGPSPEPPAAAAAAAGPSPGGADAGWEAGSDQGAALKGRETAPAPAVAAAAAAGVEQQQDAAGAGDQDQEEAQKLQSNSQVSMCKGPAAL
jgi:hypothetical protein